MGDEDPALWPEDDIAELWRHVAKLIRGQARQDARSDRIEADIAALGTDAEPETVGAGAKQALDHLKRNSERRFDLMEAQFGRLGALLRARIRSGR
jgi:hypothetical protein